jgi:DNA topoisomerase-6 subunit B
MVRSSKKTLPPKPKSQSLAPAAKKPGAGSKKTKAELSTPPAKPPADDAKKPAAKGRKSAPEVQEPAVEAKKPAPLAKPAVTVTAVEMGARQREISVSEFFTKNRHLLGFDNPRKALLTCVKEAVDNALDACEEAGILPEVAIKLEAVTNGAEPVAPSQATRFRITVTDNGPGIVRQQIPRIFAKLLYGSKFHRLRMSRGQQGIGISAAGMYGQLTTGKPVQIISRTSAKTPAHYFEVQIDTKKNEPHILEKKQIAWDQHRGTQVKLEVEGRYQKGRASVDEYIEQNIIANPHVKLTYHTPEGETKEYPRTFHELPPSPREIKPHPYGIELGMLLKMLQDTKSHSLSGFLSTEFCRVSPALAEDICKTAGLSPRTPPRDIRTAATEKLYQAIQSTKIMAPPTNCLSPIGVKAILSGLYQQIKGDFYTAVSRPPSVYRGNPFVIEAGLAYGRGPEAAAESEKQQKKKIPLAEGEEHDDGNELARVIRYANRVPLLYQQSACSVYKSVLDTTWRNYGVTQSRGALPAGPMVIFVHMASVWVPFTSESKEAIADYDEISKEITLALRECGRRLGLFLRRRERAKSEHRRRNIFELYIEEVVDACNRLKGGKLPTQKLKEQLQRIASTRTGGQKTDEMLDEKAGPEGLPESIIVTPEGVEGPASVVAVEPPEAPREASLVTHREPQGHPEHSRRVKREAPENREASGVRRKGPAKDKDGKTIPLTPKPSPKGSMKVVKSGKSVKDTPPAVKLPGRDKKKTVKLPPEEKKKPVRK